MVKPDQTIVDDKQSSKILGMEMSGVEWIAIPYPNPTYTSKRRMASVASIRGGKATMERMSRNARNRKWRLRHQDVPMLRAHTCA
jgi:hypothetical protein